MADRIETIIQQENEADLIAYLRELSPEDRGKLVPRVKELTRYYNEFGSLGGNLHGYVRGTNQQRSLLGLASFACFNRKDYERSWDNLIFSGNKVFKILDWYCPPWFDDFVNGLASGEVMPNYHLLAELAEKGLLRPSKEIITKSLPRAIYLIPGSKYEYHPELLLQRPRTLGEDIWYLFEYESDLHYCDRFMHFSDPKENLGWMRLLISLSAEGRIPRSRLLQESLLASNRNFNKVLSGWFAELFTELLPTKDELLSLQKELFSVLGCRWSKPVSVALKALKTILPAKEFDAAAFLDAMPALLASDTKAVVTTSLALLEQLGKKRPELNARIALAVCVCLVQSDDSLQTKAAQMIAAVGNPEDEALRSELEPYRQNMNSGAKQLLTAFFKNSTTASNSGAAAREADTAGSESVEAESSSPISFPATRDDLVFLASQVFDNNEPWHLDLLPAALIDWTPRLTAEDIPLFEPAFQRALKLRNNPSASAGNLDLLLALFFLDYGVFIMKQFPAATANLRRLYGALDQKDFLSSWKSPKNVFFYEPHRQLLLLAYQRIVGGNTLPLLSTPTHSPCWVDGGVLAQRLLEYQDSRQPPDEMDWQMAVSRWRKGEDVASFAAAADRLIGESRQLVQYLAAEAAVAPPKRSSVAAVWVTAALVKRDEAAFGVLPLKGSLLQRCFGRMDWTVKVSQQSYNRYDRKKQEHIPTTISVKQLVVATGSGSILAETSHVDSLLYGALRFAADFIAGEDADIRRILSLAPNNPEALLGDIVGECFASPEFWEEAQRRLAIQAVQWLYEMWRQPGEMSYLMLATSLLSAEKQVANTAAELWLKAVSAGDLDNAKLGAVIGRLESVEYAPLKRFTDLLPQRLFRVSPLHNRALQVLIEHVLMQLPEEPVRGLKKLQEIYKEVTQTHEK